MTRTGETEGAGAYGAVDPRAAVEELRASLRTLLATLPLLDRAFGIALERVEDLARWLDEVAAHGGVRLNALLGGARAAIGGRSPVWGAIVGAVRGMSPAARVALVVALVLAVLLLPVTVVLLLLFLIVAGSWPRSVHPPGERARGECGRLPTGNAPNGLISDVCSESGGPICVRDLRVG